MSETTPPSSPSDSPEAIIREELAKAASLITASQGLMAEGRSVDLSAIEDRVRIITETVSGAPPDVAASFKDHLTTLLEILDTLEADIEQQQQQLDDNLSSMKRRTATHAYGAPKVASSPSSIPEEDE